MQAYIALLDGGDGCPVCFAWGRTLNDCRWNFRGQIAGAGRYAASMLERVRYVPVSDEQASEVAEMLAAPWIVEG